MENLPRGVRGGGCAWDVQFMLRACYSEQLQHFPLKRKISMRYRYSRIKRRVWIPHPVFHVHVSMCGLCGLLGRDYNLPRYMFYAINYDYILILYSTKNEMISINVQSVSLCLSWLSCDIYNYHLYFWPNSPTILWILYWPLVTCINHLKLMLYIAAHTTATWYRLSVGIRPIVHVIGDEDKGVTCPSISYWPTLETTTYIYNVLPCANWWGSWCR